MSKNPIIKGTLILTITGFLTRLIGFFFRMFLSHTFGEEQVGLYQLIFPLYALCISLSAAGIEIALSRNVARKISMGKKKEADIMLYQALLISGSLSLILSYVIRRCAAPFSIYILGDLRCEPLLQALTYALPFASIHSCICGYYLGQKKTEIPAISQLCEQLGRVISVYIIYKVLEHSQTQVSIVIAVLGLAIGEIISALFCMRRFSISPHAPLCIATLKKGKHLLQEWTSMAIPLTSSRVLMNILQSVETISIPLCLQTFGHTNSEALSTYGVLTGMALPCIFFPTAITNSVSTVLLPTVAEIEAENNLVRLKGLIQKVISFGFCLGTICGLCFLFLGAFLGNLLFNSPLAGDYLRTLAWICPFLYMNNTLISILNGLGKATNSFLINVFSLAIRILGVWVGICSYGMKGYLWGLLISQLVVSILCIWNLKWYIASRQLE